MAIENIIARGIGFSPGSTKFIPTHGFSIGIAALTLIPLSSLVLDIGNNIGKTLMPQGNILPISIVTTAPTAAPAGNKGVVFMVSGGTPTIYIWDGSVWRTIV